MLVLRADPWDPEFGMGFEAMEEAEAPGVDPDVERRDWGEAIAPVAQESPLVRFVDGVRRIDLRLIATEDGVRVPGLFGSFAVGCVERDGRARFGDHVVGRVVVLGGGVRPAAVHLRVGGIDLTYEPATEPGSEPDQPLRGLQQRMRKAEGALAARAASDEEAVVLVDGPLGFTDPTAGAVVGVVKRSVRAYLDPAHDALIAHLAPGQRTPLFALGVGSNPIDRYSWYTRLVAQQAMWHDHAGVVRCEVREGVGLERAVELADRVTAMLPTFAGRPSDPRAPQNLAPVGALEGWLKRHLGHAGLIRRALTESIMEGAA